MSEPIRIDLPVSRERLAELSVGDEVRLFGPVYTSRDAGHELLLGALAAEGMLPHGLVGATLFYAGPTPAAAGRPVGSVGPTTAKRMDAATPALLRAGVVAAIGKGGRSEAVRAVFAETGSVYFGAVGGAAALLATHVIAAEPVAWPHLGTEALVRMTLDDFPAFVAIDVAGNDLYADAPAAWRAERDAADASTGPRDGAR
ncbi:MAG: fumarate hydratase C-terminal domain-containing protein [Coriobacteriia bacterium]